ncbi:MAG: rhodanese-like domain-containing protein [Candidatus Omnitrophota bacterium]
MFKRVILGALVMMFLCAQAFAMCGTCGMCGGSTCGTSGAAKNSAGTYGKVVAKANARDDVREITYRQFMSIRTSGEKYRLLDVLDAESYKKGHIEGAESFPVNTIDQGTAASRLSKDDHIVVFCGGFKCKASTEAAKKLSGMGYEVLDYKGGLKDWQDKGNKLVQ